MSTSEEMDCEICGNGPLQFHAGMCVMGHPKVGDIVPMPLGRRPCMVYVCEIFPDQGYTDRTIFRGSRQGPIAPCNEDFMKEISS